MALKSASVILIGFLVLTTMVVSSFAAVEADQLLGNLLGLVVNIQGTVFCTLNGAINGTLTPVFPNATVNLLCNGTLLSSTTTNASGMFSMVFKTVQAFLPTLLNTCQLVVPTPLSTCNPTLPTTGGLISSLQVLLSSIVGGILNILTLGPTGFMQLPLL